MILIGQYDSPFVRRVGIALTLYGIPFEHRPWSVFSDADKIHEHNPLTRVPVLLLDSGEALVDTHLIVDHIDSLVSDAQVMAPRSGPGRHQALRICGLAAGMSDKAVSLYYEKALHQTVSQVWVERCLGQIRGTLAVLERDRAARSGPYWFGDRIGHADIAVAASLRHATDSHPGVVTLDAFPALAAHSAALEALPVFQAISQPFIPPA
jgi:glutathione S-transferase